MGMIQEINKRNRKSRDDKAVQHELKEAYNEPKGDDDKPYLMLPRNGKPGESVATEVAGGGMAGLKKTGKSSPEGIPYADLGIMNISSRVKNLGDYAHPPKRK